MSDTPEESPLDDVGGVEESLVIPPELPILPLRDTVLFRIPSCRSPWRARVRCA